MGKGVSSHVLVLRHVICVNFLHICAPTPLFIVLPILRLYVPGGRGERSFVHQA